MLNNRIHDLPYDGIVISGVRPRFFNITDPVKWTVPDVIPQDLRENMLTIRWDECGRPQNAEEARRFAHARNNLIRDNELNDVMHDAILGAWALKHAGYATDPKYALKLIRIIYEYNLLELDLTGI